MSALKKKPAAKPAKPAKSAKLAKAVQVKKVAKAPVKAAKSAPKSVKPARKAVKPAPKPVAKVAPVRRAAVKPIGLRPRVVPRTSRRPLRRSPSSCR